MHISGYHYQAIITQSVHYSCNIIIQAVAERVVDAQPGGKIKSRSQRLK
jgi:hypothetical protein